MSKVTFSEAATAAGVHFNTLRNWRKANKLTTAEKVFENGVEIWIVELSEVEQLARQSRHKRADNNKASVDGPNAEMPPVDVPGPSEAPPNGMTTIPAGFDNFMALVERSQKPLLEQIGTLTNKVESLARENGELQERLRALEAAQAAQDAARLAESPPPPTNTPRTETGSQTAQEPSPILHSDTLEPITTPTKKGFWARLLGG